MGISFAQIQEVDDIISTIEEQPVEIVDTLNRTYDQRKLEVRKWDKQMSDEYSGRDFNYRQVQGTSQNLMGRFLSWLLEGLQDIFGFKLSPITVKILTYLFYFLIGGVVIYMIVRLLGNESASKLFGKTPKNTSSVSIEETHIESIDLNAYITQSEEQGNYRNAIRYQFLAMLKLLSAQAKIDWTYQKTNADYYRELQDPVTKELFKKLSYLYDHVWYGAFPIDASSYREAVTQFNHLKSVAA